MQPTHYFRQITVEQRVGVFDLNRLVQVEPPLRLALSENIHLVSTDRPLQSENYPTGHHKLAAIVSRSLDPLSDSASSTCPDPADPVLFKKAIVVALEINSLQLQWLADEIVIH